LTPPPATPPLHAEPGRRTRRAGTALLITLALLAASLPLLPGSRPVAAQQTTDDPQSEATVIWSSTLSTAVGTKFNTELGGKFSLHGDITKGPAAVVAWATNIFDSPGSANVWTEPLLSRALTEDFLCYRLAIGSPTDTLRFLSDCGTFTLSILELQLDNGTCHLHSPPIGADAEYYERVWTISDCSDYLDLFSDGPYESRHYTNYTETDYVTGLFFRWNYCSSDRDTYPAYFTWLDSTNEGPYDDSLQNTSLQIIAYEPMPDKQPIAAYAYNRNNDQYEIDYDTYCSQVDSEGMLRFINLDAATAIASTSLPPVESGTSSATTGTPTTGTPTTDTPTTDTPTGSDDAEPPIQDRPGPPRDVRLRLIGNELVATWRPPANDGGAEISNYSVTFRSRYAEGAQAEFVSDERVPANELEYEMRATPTPRIYEVTVAASYSYGDPDRDGDPASATYDMNQNCPRSNKYTIKYPPTSRFGFQIGWKRLVASTPFITVDPNVSIQSNAMGGTVNSKDNVSQDGCAWVTEEAAARNNSKIRGNALISGKARVANNAQVEGNARVTDEAEVSENATVSDDAIIQSAAQVYDKAKVCGGAIVGNEYSEFKVSVHGMDRPKVFDKARICGSSRVIDEAHVYGNAIVEGGTIEDNAKVYGNARVCANSDGEPWSRCSPTIGEDARVWGDAHIDDNATVYGMVSGAAKVYGDALVHGTVFGNATVYGTAIVPKSTTLTAGEFDGDQEYKRAAEELLAVVRMNLIEEFSRCSDRILGSEWTPEAVEKLVDEILVVTPQTDWAKAYKDMSNSQYEECGRKLGIWDALERVIPSGFDLAFTYGLRLVSVLRLSAYTKSILKAVEGITDLAELKDAGTNSVPTFKCRSSIEISSIVYGLSEEELNEELERNGVACLKEAYESLTRQP